MARKPLSKRTRFDVFKRDDFSCVYCGSSPPDVKLHADHMIPVVEGGSDDLDNLVTACDSCNLGKGPRPLGSDVHPAASPENIEEMKERKAQVAAYRRHMRSWLKQKRAAEDEQVQMVAEEFAGRIGVTWPIEGEAKTRAQVLGFIRSLGLKRVIEAAGISYKRNARNQFAYFCACCLNMIREEREDA